MKDKLKIIKFNKRILALTLYLFFVWDAYLFINASDLLNYIVHSVKALSISWLISCLIVEIVGRVNISYVQKNKRQLTKAFIMSLVFAFTIMLLWYIAYYPGFFSSDCIGQYEEAINNRYSDWHPFWQTFVFYKVPLIITGNVASIGFFQLCYFSLLVGYLGMILYKHTNAIISIVSLCYIVLNPYVNCIILYPWKDVGFAIFGCLALVITIDIFLCKKCSTHSWRTLVLGVTLANTTLFRHNAILFTAVLAIALMFVLENKQKFILFASFIAFIVIIKGPVYNILEVSKPGNRVIETSGLPLTIFANVVKEAPEKLDDEMSELAYSMTSKENWSQYYECGNFNAIKHSTESKLNLAPIEALGRGNMLRIMGKCFFYAPKESMRAFISLTDIVYGISEQEIIYCEIAANNNGIKYKGNHKLFRFLFQYKCFISDTFFSYIQFTGLALLVLTSAVIAKSDLGDPDWWKKILIIASIYVYDFGTMLLLTGPDFRFFFITILVMPPMVALMLRKKN